MKSSRSGVLLAIGVLVAVLVFLWMQGAGEKPAPEVGAPDGESVRAAPAPDAAELSPPAASAPERSELAAEARPAEPETWPPADRTKLYFRGRCVAAESGAPLAGCTVQFSGWQGNSELIARYGEPDWKDPDPVVTGVDGRFQFEVPETLPYQFALDVKAAGRLGRSDRYDTELPGGTAYDLGDVVLQRGARVTMSLRDQHGAPVPKARVIVDQLPRGIRAILGSSDSAVGQSDAEGIVLLDQAIPAGSWPLRLDAHAFLFEGPDVLTVEPGQEAVHLDLRLRSMPSIEGIVVDEDGAPVAQAYVRSVREGGGRQEGGYSNAAGRFQIYLQREQEEPVRLQLECQGFERMTSEVHFPWGAREVRLEARRLLDVVVLVRERESGAPVENYSLRCHPVDANSSAQTGIRLGGHHAGGLVSVPDVNWGENLIQILPQDPALMYSPRTRFQAPRLPDDPLIIELERLTELQVRLLTVGGDPVPGSTVALLDRRPEEWQTLHFLDARRGAISIESGDESDRALLWSLAQSDADGRATLHAPAHAGVVFARVEGSHPLHLEEIQAPFARENPLIIRVAQGARLRGRLIHPAVGTGTVGVSVRSDPAHSGGFQPALPDGAGEFEVHGLAAGTYSLAFSFQTKFHDLRGGASLWWRELDPPLSEARLEEGESREVLLDASHFAFSSLRGRLEMPAGCGEVQSVELRLTRPGADGRPQAIQAFGLYVVNSALEFQAEGLPPGTYEASVETVLGGRGYRLKCLDTVHLEAAVSAAHTFRCARLRLRVRLLDAAGAPIVGAVVARGDIPVEGEPLVVSDAHGWVELDWMSPGPANLRLRTDPRRYLHGVQVDPALPVTTLEARAWTDEEWQAERARQSGGG